MSVGKPLSPNTELEVPFPGSAGAPGLNLAHSQTLEHDCYSRSFIPSRCGVKLAPAELGEEAERPRGGTLR